jgi:hypothetical protein
MLDPAGKKTDYCAVLTHETASGRGAAVAHVLWEHEAAGSNPAAPTTNSAPNSSPPGWPPDEGTARDGTDRPCSRLSGCA